MAIKIIREPDIHLTEDELLRYRRAYDDFVRHCVEPPSFEAFVRSNPFKRRSFAEAVAEAQRLVRWLCQGCHNTHHRALPLTPEEPT